MITIRRKIVVDLSFEDFRKSLKRKKYTEEEINKYWKLLEKRTNLNTILEIEGSMADLDVMNEPYEKTVLKEIRDIIIPLLAGQSS